MRYRDLERKCSSRRDRQCKGPKAGTCGMFEVQHGGWYIWRGVNKLLNDL